MELNKEIIKHKSLILEDINLDINDILSFTVNIDNLKIFLSTLLKNQTILSKKILEIENKLKLKRPNIDSQRERNKLAKSLSMNYNLNKIKDSYQKKKSKNDLINKKEENNNSNINDQNINENNENNDNENKEKDIDEIEEENKLKEDNNKEKEKENLKGKDEKNVEENNININIIQEAEENKELYSSKDNNKNDEELYSDKENKYNENVEDKDESNEENVDEDNNEDYHEDNDEDIFEIKPKNKKYFDNKKKTEETEKGKGKEIVMNNYEIFEINNKIKMLKKKIKNLELLSKVNKYTSNVEDKSEDIEMLKYIVKDLNTDNKNLKKENEEIKKQLEDINVKLTDINIYDIFKDCQLEDGSIDAAKALVLALEQKIFKKIALMDERDKKLGADILDLKTKIQNVVNKNGVIDHHINDVRKNMKELGELVAKSNNDNTNNMNNFENKMNKIYKELFNKYDEKNNTLESNIQKLNDKILNLEKFKNENMNLNTINNNNLELNEETLQFLKQLNNRINEIENKINSILDSAELNPTKEDLAKLEKEISKKLNIKDFYELKEKYNIQLAKANNLEENIERIQDISEKNNSELIFYTKKVENLTSNVVSLKAQIEDIIHKEENKLLDLTRYLEKVTFHKFLNSTQIEKKKIENNFEEIRKIINDISKTIQTKCNSEDLKVFENIINNKIEELKLINIKRFADKVDTNKSMKYLDTQIRHIIDVYIKRMEKNDSWLIAKKPIGGFSCASCESYLGELKNKENYLPWNKYPQREKDNYRVGNGFSRMLNMLNVELKNNELNYIEKAFESDDEIKNSEENRFKMRIKNSSNSHRDIKSNKSSASTLFKNNYSNITNKSNLLPKILMKNEEINVIEQNNNTNDVGNETIVGVLGEENSVKENKESNEAQPHIVKIFKKTKITPMDSSRSERPGTHHIK